MKTKEKKNITEIKTGQPLLECTAHLIPTLSMLNNASLCKKENPKKKTENETLSSSSPGSVTEPAVSTPHSVD